jgi:hypothetical protein
LKQEIQRIQKDLSDCEKLLQDYQRQINELNRHFNLYAGIETDLQFAHPLIGLSFNNKLIGRIGYSVEFEYYTDTSKVEYKTLLYFKF